MPAASSVVAAVDPVGAHTTREVQASRGLHDPGLGRDKEMSLIVQGLIELRGQAPVTPQPELVLPLPTQPVQIGPGVAHPEGVAGVGLESSDMVSPKRM